jgi:CheY-like chemotaxis protein
VHGAEPVSSTVLSHQLKTLGFLSESVGGGVEALAALETGEYGLVISDVYMDDMDGRQLARRIRAAEAEAGTARMPIIARALEAAAASGAADAEVLAMLAHRTSEALADVIGNETTERLEAQR